MNEREIFDAALAISDSQERSVFLEQACGKNQSQRREIEEMLAAQQRLGSFLQGRPFELGETIDSLIVEKPGTEIGPYKLLQRIGEGGFGVVYMAEQTRPVRRKVALKIIKPGMDTKEVIARFEAERQALALMDHPNIAKVFDAGATDKGRPYFVMELVKGVPLTNFCDENQLNTKQRLELFATICLAIQHAHQKGIIHRDLKPSNVMVTIHDNQPVPKVIDFGVSKAISQQLTEKTLFTAYGQMVGTPTYMSPEQAQMSGMDVDTRSDIYSLGVLLFELLTGSTPLDAERLRRSGYEEMQRLIREEEAPRPSQRMSTQSADALARIAKCRGAEPGRLESQLRGELDWIVIKTLEKDRSRRYETASGLARDVQRYLVGETVEACPPTLSYRLRKLYRRNRGAILTAGSFTAVLLIASVVSLVFGILAKRSERRAIEQEQLAAASAEEAIASRAEAQRERDDALAAKEHLARVEYARSIQLADSSIRGNNVTVARNALDSARPELRGWEWHYLNGLCQGDPLFEIRKPWLQSDPSQVELSYYAMFSPDGESILINSRIAKDTLKSGEDRGRVMIVDAKTRTERFPWEQMKFPKYVKCELVSADKLFLVQENQIVIRDLSNNTDVFELKPGEDQRFVWAHLSYDGKRVAVSERPVGDSEIGRIITVRDTGTKERLWAWETTRKQHVAVHGFDRQNGWLLGEELGHNRFDYEPAIQKASIIIWDGDTGAELLRFTDPDVNAGPLAFPAFCPAQHEPNEGRFATSLSNGDVKIWTVQLNDNRLEIVGDPVVLRGNGTGLTRVTFSPDGKRVVTTSPDQARIWDAETGVGLRDLKWTNGWSQANFSPDGRKIITVSRNVSAKVWSADSQSEDPHFCNGNVLYCSLNPADEKSIVLGGGMSVQLWHADAPEAELLCRGLFPTFSPNGRFIAAITYENSNQDGKVSVFDFKSKKEIYSLDVDGLHFYRPFWNRSGTHLLVVTNKKTAIVWDIQKKNGVEFGERRERTGERASVNAGFNPDGSQFFIEYPPSENAESLGAITVYDALTYKRKFDLEDTGGICGGDWTGSFSPDGTQFVAFVRNSSGDQNEWRIWNAKTGALLKVVSTASSVQSFEFSPDGKRMISTSGFSYYDAIDAPKIWDAETCLELMSIPDGRVNVGTFSPDGNKVVLGGRNGALILDGTPLAESEKP